MADELNNYRYSAASRQQTKDLEEDIKLQVLKELGADILIAKLNDMLGIAKYHSRDEVVKDSLAATMIAERIPDITPDKIFDSELVALRSKVLYDPTLDWQQAYDMCEAFKAKYGES